MEGDVTAPAVQNHDRTELPSAQQQGNQTGLRIELLLWRLLFGAVAVWLMFMGIGGIMLVMLGVAVYYGHQLTRQKSAEPSSGSSTARPNTSEQLRSLHALYKQGALTEEEFASAKARLLSE